jgi:uncharacterized protein YndB with AHSA1/START domain
MSKKDEPVTGTAATVISRPIAEVFEAISDVTRMGEWSSECTAGRWVDGTDGPALGAKFEGDNVASMGPVTLKRWTTTSEITDYVPNETFGFVASDHTQWRYDFLEREGKTVVTESFSHPPFVGWQGVVYATLMRRQLTMIKGMQSTLDQIKEVLEG